MNQSDGKPGPARLEFSPAKALFIGNLFDEAFFPFPAILPAERETLQMIIESIDRFMTGRDEEFRAHDKKGEQPEEYIQSIRELGLFGLIIGEEYGGIGLSNSGYSRALQQTSRYDASTSLTIGAHSSIGMKGILLFGTDEQKRKYLPKLATGETIAAFCLTESGSGSDAGSIKTNATKNPDGTWTLNGEKIWITNGGTADVFTVFARTDTEEGKMTSFVVERQFTGVSNGPKEDKMGIRASCTTTVSFDNVILPADAVLGGEGKGFKVAMSILNNGRTGLGGGCVGGMKRCIELATKQAMERKQFGKSIVEFGLVREKLGQMAVQCFATESVVSMVAHYIDTGSTDYSVEAAMSKVFASESMWNVAFDSLQIAGGNGYMKEFPYERMVRDSRINLIFEGTNEILRLYIALSGFKDAGDYFKDIQRSIGNVLNDPIKGFGVLGSYGKKKLAQYTPYRHAKLDAVAPALKDEALAYERYSVQLAKASESLLRRHGKKIVDEQFSLKRVADISIDLFIGLCVLSRVTACIAEKGETACADEISIARIFTRQAKRRINQNLRRLEKNEDELVSKLAGSLVEHAGYRWDVL